MTALIERVTSDTGRSVNALSTDDWLQMFSFGSFPLNLPTTMGGQREEIEQTYEGLTWGAYRANGIIFACILARFMLFSEARFQFRQLRGGKLGDLFGTSALSLLERPEPGKTTGDLLSRAILDVDIGGNCFEVRRPGRIKRLRPDWVAILRGSPRRDTSLDPWDVDAEFLGIVYVPGGFSSGNEPETYSAAEVTHWAPIPDPLAQYRGMSWILPVLRELMADSSATLHKLKFYENAATPNAVIKFEPTIQLKAAKEWIDLFEEEHRGVMNAYKTAYLGGGASLEVVGMDFQKADFKAIQAAGEVRIAAAAGVHPVIVGISEGLQGSALNSGNFMAARRLLGDRTMRPLWRGLAGSLETITEVPSASQLWYDDTDISFLAEDRKDAAEVLGKHAEAIVALGNAGWEHSSVVQAVVAGDLSLLRHSGLVSVQLQPPGTGQAIATETFWPVTGAATGRWVEEGQVLSASDPVVAAFPHLFSYERIQPRGTGAAPIVSRDQVIDARQRLQAAGRPAGYDSLARELDVSAATVRRRLAGS